ncbi:hypothetical protein [Mycobacterium uberis]|uniref:hypothetical protein n=1 Tax=Mycobacterium uberis TaxID=2162698 RepID=UPI000E301D33|nr:hypothetical protein [Mycobacterium uberis]
MIAPIVCRTVTLVEVWANPGLDADNVDFVLCRAASRRNAFADSGMSPCCFNTIDSSISEIGPRE